MKIEDYRNMKNIERLSLHPIQRSYNLLEHSYMVAILFSHFANLEDVSYDIQVFKKVLHHDILETITGDLAYTVKNLSDTTKEAWGHIEDEVINENPRFEHYSDKAIETAMTPLQFKLFKVCDLLDLWIFIKEEIALGNRDQEILNIERRCVALIKGPFPSIDTFISTYKCYKWKANFT